MVVDVAVVVGCWLVVVVVVVVVVVAAGLVLLYTVIMNYFSFVFVLFCISYLLKTIFRESHQKFHRCVSSASPTGLR